MRSQADRAGRGDPSPLFLFLAALEDAMAAGAPALTRHIDLIYVQDHFIEGDWEHILNGAKIFLEVRRNQ